MYFHILILISNHIISDSGLVEIVLLQTYLFSFLLPIYIRIQKLGDSTTQPKLWNIWPNNLPKGLYDKHFKLNANKH